MREQFGAAVACVATVATVLLVLGCGGGSDPRPSSSTPPRAVLRPGGATEQPLSPAEQHGQELFVQNCGSCHTFHAAGTIGQIGPDLNDIAITDADVLHAIRTGGGPHSHGAGGRPETCPGTW